MPAKAIVAGITLVIMVMLLVCMTEYFLPLSKKAYAKMIAAVDAKKAELDMLCRNALLRMENNGGFSSADSMALRLKLEEKGLTDVAVTATPNAGQGGMLTLFVEGDYSYNRITALFRRKDVKVHMVYHKSSMSRKVVN